MKHYYKNLLLASFLFMLLGLNSKVSQAQLLINESFNTVVPLPTGWAQQNLSSPIGSAPTWFQGNPATFTAFNGATNAYIGVNFNSVGGANTINNWLFTPQVAIANGNVFSFYTRAATGGGIFPDRLEVRMSTNGASVNVGATNTSVGDFTAVLVSVNPTLTSTGYPEVWTQYSVTITGVPTPTTGRFAFRYFVTDGGPSGANSNFIGVDQVEYGVACTGTPAPGNTIASVATICPTVPFNLSLQNAATGLGVTYQWQSGPSATGPWTNIAGATNSTLTRSQTVATYYRAVVTCSGNSGISNPVFVDLLTCYCPAGATSTAFEKIGRVVFSTINNPSTSTAGYEDFTAISAPVFQGANMPMTVTISGGFAADRVLVWIDFNKDFDFDDAGELVYTSPTGVGPHTGNIAIPATVATGATRMRIRMHDTSLGGNATPCGTSTYGQVEDYTVNIVPCVPTSVTTPPSNTSVTCGANTTITAAVAGSLPTVFWQYRTSATSTTWINVPNVAPYSGANSTTLTITAATDNLNGYQYRIVHSGVCNGVDFSIPATLTVNRLVPVVNPAAPGICLGTVQSLSLTNSVAAEVTSTFGTTGLPSIIPDNDLANPMDKVIAVSGIPAGSIIKNVRVRMNINHTWVGDVIANLRAPNGQTLNLFALLNGATGGNGTANFTNTIIDSLSTTPISGAAAPRTGSYAAERYNITAPPTIVTTTPFWSSLLTTINGNWTVRFVDGGAGDVGTITALELIIVYTAPGLAEGVWTGPAGTIFTDAAGTTPYTGAPATTVFVNPGVTGLTNYNVSFATPLCQSATTTVPVTVRSLPTSTTAIANRSICINGSTSFTSTPAGGAGFATQWQVSTDGGATFTNVANGGAYSGATTNTLSLASVPASFNGNRYRLTATAAPCVGSVNSTVATLTVNPTPVVAISASPLMELYPGQTTTLRATVSPNPGATFTWFRNGVPVAGANSNTLVVDVDGLGVYTASVTDVNGCSGTSTAAIEIKDAANDILFIYPSPNSGQFQVRFFSGAGNNPLPRTINIYDNKGSRIYTRAYTIAMPYTRMDVDLKNHGKGIYNVELTDGNGRRLKTGRVVIN